MKKTDLNIFFELGHSFGYLLGAGSYGVGKEYPELLVNLAFPRQWLLAFLNQTNEFERYLSDSRKAAEALLRAIRAITDPDRARAGHPVTQEECDSLVHGAAQLDECFERETRKLSVFTVTPKGTRDTGILIESPEDDFTPDQQKILPKQFLYDLKQAARCLAFDAPTACAFHVCRATEALMLAYYEKLAGQPWPYPNKGWDSYIDHLVKLKAPTSITDRLREIKSSDRNAYIHPDKSATIEEARVLYSLCDGVNYYMAEEMA